MQRFEYRVLTEADSLFRRKFDWADIEKALNQAAADGWRVVTCEVSDVGRHQHFVILLERPVLAAA